MAKLAENMVQLPQLYVLSEIKAEQLLGLNVKPYKCGRLCVRAVKMA